MRKSNKGRVLNYLTEYIILTRNELQSFSSLSEFGKGAVLAYIECLEILSNWSGFKKFSITDIEKHFGIN